MGGYHYNPRLCWQHLPAIISIANKYCLLSSIKHYLGISLSSWLSCLDTNSTGWDCSVDCPVQLHSTLEGTWSVDCPVQRLFVFQWSCLIASPHTPFSCSECIVGSIHSIQHATVFVWTLYAFTSAQWSNIVIHSHTYFFKTWIHAMSSAMVVENEDEDDLDANFLMVLKEVLYNIHCLFMF